MYAHAYQSYVWNLVSSERVKLSATEPLVGDLVYANKEDDAEEPVEGESARLQGCMYKLTRRR